MKLYSLALGFLTMIVASTFGQNVCTIKGKIDYPKDKFILLRYQDQYNLFDYIDTIYVNKDGSFHHVWRMDHNTKDGALQIAPKKYIPVWGCRNNTISIHIKDSLYTPVYRGSLAKIHNYFQESQTYWKKIFTEYLERNPSFRKEETDRTVLYYAITDSMYTDRISHLKQYFDKSGLWYEKAFMQQQLQTFIYNNLNWKCYYEPQPKLERFVIYRQHYSSVPAGSNYLFSDKIDFNGPNLFDNREFLKFSTSFVRAVAADLLKKINSKWTTDSYLVASFSVINKLSTDKKCNALLKTGLLNDGIDNFKYTEPPDSVIQVYRRYIDTIKACAVIKKQAIGIENKLDEYVYRQQVSAVKKGNPAPECFLTDTTGKVYSWIDFAGKFIYIDVWASWCKPCIASIPAWNKLAEKYKDRDDVVFITVSLDADIDRWKKAIKKYDPHGLLLVSRGEDFQSEFAQKFLVSAIPANILIDKSGKMIQAKAERPEGIDLEKYLK